ncbi:TPA: dihydrolipoyl dehydrogenase [Candidatus Sumerlaeota bacterium]|jgi:dihydrolipoamide dehydrogenase|nr:dihydrolipoyl dehydrogenase [Candidatus Sumerlaeota bacterium]
MSSPFDVLVIGSGPGGYVAALKAAQMGAKTAVVEMAKHPGGTCLNYGCIPSKALLASAELLHHINHAAEFGVTVGSTSFDWSAIQKRKDGVLRRLRGGITSLFGGRKIAYIQGRAQLNGPGKVTVDAGDNKVSEITAKKIILAVGSAPARISAWPQDLGLVCTSDEALHWNTLPESLLIVGGGVIGCEFACMMHSFGVQVAIVEMQPRLLPEMDEQLGEAMKASLTKRGITIFTDTKVDSLVGSDKGCHAALSNGKKVNAERTLIAVGRRPNTQGIGLETVGIETDRGFIRVNEYMETAAKDIYCIGDANGRCLLAHAASAQGVCAVKNALGHREAFNAPIPGAVYTYPEIGSVGMTQQEARAKGIPYSVGNFPIGFLGKAMAAGDTEGFAKVIRNRETDEILGVHMLGHNATECIAAAGALLHTKATVNEMAEVVFAHPSISEGLKEAAEDALGMALHMAPRKVLRVKA